jgi:hypothetical protein
MFQLRQGVRQRAEGCVALAWNLGSVDNDPLGVPGITPLYSRLPSVWGVEGGELLDSFCSWDRIGIQRKRKQFSTLQKKEGLPSKEIPTRSFQRGGGGSGEPSSGAGTTSEPPVVVLAKGRDRPVMRNLPEVTSRNFFRESAILAHLKKEF